jgi:hypothetical protein
LFVALWYFNRILLDIVDNFHKLAFTTSEKVNYTAFIPQKAATNCNLSKQGSEKAPEQKSHQTVQSISSVAQWLCWSRASMMKKQSTETLKQMIVPEAFVRDAFLD